MRILSIRRGRLVATLTDHREPVLGITFTPDGEHILSCSKDKTIRRATCAGQDCRIVATFRKVPNALAISPNGQLLAVGLADHSVRIMQTANWAEVHNLPFHSDVVTAVAFSPKGNLVASGSGDCTVRIIDAETGDQRHCLSTHTKEIFSVAFSPDGALIGTGSRDKTARLFDTKTGHEMYCIADAHRDHIKAVCFTHTGCAAGG